MSGVCGLVCGKPNRDIESIVDGMSRAISHRGSYEEKIVEDNTVAFAVRDRKGGVYSSMIENKSDYSILCSGNVAVSDGLYEELSVSNKNLLECAWKGYKKYGESFFNKFEGGFVFVIYDKKAGKVIVARDLFAQLPIFIAIQKENIWFSSEYKSFLADANFKKNVNPNVIPAAITYGVTMGPETLLKNVYKVAPGCCFICSLEGSFSIKPFFRPASQKKVTQSIDCFVSEIWEELGDNIKRQLNGNKRNALFLSGGVDSSLVVKKLSSIVDSAPIALTCGYKESTVHDESELASIVAEDCGAKLSISSIGCDDNLLSILRSVVWRMEEPTRFFIAMPILKALEEHKGEFSCLLTGVFADQFFGLEDHPNAIRHSEIKRMSSAKKCLIRALRPFLSRFPMTRSFARSFEQADYESLVEYTFATYQFNHDSLGVIPLGKKPKYNSLGRHLDQMKPHLAGMSADDEWSLVSMMSMIFCWNEIFETLGSHAGVDVVNPFQSKKMLELSQKMPYEYKFSGSVMKPVLRDLASLQFSEGFAHLKKKQFSSPLHLWMTESKELREAIIGLKDESSRIKKFLNPSAVNDCVDEFEKKSLSGKSGYKVANTLFSLLGLELWLEQFID